MLYTGSYQSVIRLFNFIISTSVHNTVHHSRHGVHIVTLLSKNFSLFFSFSNYCQIRNSTFEKVHYRSERGFFGGDKNVSSFFLNFMFEKSFKIAIFLTSFFKKFTFFQFFLVKCPIMDSLLKINFCSASKGHIFAISAEKHPLKHFSNLKNIFF